MAFRKLRRGFRKLRGNYYNRIARKSGGYFKDGIDAREYYKMRRKSWRSFGGVRRNVRAMAKHQGYKGKFKLSLPVIGLLVAVWYFFLRPKTV